MFRHWGCRLVLPAEEARVKLCDDRSGILGSPSACARQTHGRKPLRIPWLAWTQASVLPDASLEGLVALRAYGKAPR